MVKETKKTRNKGKITIVLRKGTAILLALIMVLTVGVTNAKAETAGTVYGKENLDWSKDELDQIVDPHIKTRDSDNTEENYKDSAGKVVKRVYYNPYESSDVTITYYNPKKPSEVIGYKNIDCCLYSNLGDSWQCSYSLYNGDNMSSASKLKRYNINLDGNGLRRIDDYSVSIVNGTKTITQTDYFYPNIKKNDNNLELIQTVTIKTYNVANGVEKLTESSVTENKAISKNGDKEEVKVYTATTTEGENGNRTVCYKYFENDGTVLAKRVIDTVEHRGDASTGYYVITGRTTEYYENGAPSYSTEEEFEIYGSDYVKTQTTKKDASGNVTSVAGVTATPDCSYDYLGRKTYTANFVASPGAISSGKVVTRISTEDNSVAEEEYDSEGYLFRVTTRDDKCNILTTEERVDSSREEVIGFSHIRTDEFKDPFGKVTRRITYTDDIDAGYYSGGRIDEELYYKSETEDNKVKQKTSTSMDSYHKITARTTEWFDDDAEKTKSREWIEAFDKASGALINREERTYNEGEYTYTSKYYDGNKQIGTGYFIKNTTASGFTDAVDILYVNKHDEDGTIREVTTIRRNGSGSALLLRETKTQKNDGSVTTKVEDAFDNSEKAIHYKEITTSDGLTIKEKEWSPQGEVVTEWFYENNEKKYGEETRTAADGAKTIRKIDTQGNEIDKPISVTVTLSETNFTYTGSEIKPTVTVKGVNGETEIGFTENTDYTVSYENNTEVGTAKAVVTDVFGGTYEVIGSAEFFISQASISPKVEMSGWTAGSSASEPVITGNPGNGTVTVSYKGKDADDATYTDNKPATAGQYTVMVKIAETKNYKGGSATADFTVSAPATQPVDDPNQGTSSGTETTSGTETEPTSGTTSGTDNETTSGTTTGTDDKDTSGSGTTTGTDDKDTSGSGTTTGTDDKNSSGTGNGNTSGTTTGTENLGTSEKDKEEKDNSGSTTVREEKTNEDGSTVIKEETKNKDGSSVVKEEIKNTDGSTVVKEETTAADGSTVIKEETTDENGNVSSTETATDADGTVTKREEIKDATGAGSATEVVADAQGNVLSTTEETTTVSKKGTVTVTAVTKNSDDSTVEMTQKNYKADKEGNVKTVTNLTETASDGSVVKTKETTVVDAKGNTTAVTKKTSTTEEGKKEVTTTTAELDAKGKGVIVTETKVGKTTTASETYALSSAGTAKVTKLETKETTVIVPEAIEVAGKEVPVTTISKNAMKNNKKITDVTIGENITTVGAGAFKGSKNLANVSLTASITKISKNAFAGIAPNAVFKIKGTKEDFDRIVALLKESGVADTVTFELDKS